jgi:PAS domain S-box-containing protein
MITGYLVVTTFLLLGMVVLLITRKWPSEGNTSLTDFSLQGILESIGEPIILIDAGNNIVWNNMATERTFGKVTGKRCAEVFQCKEKPGFGCSVSGVFDEGKILTVSKKFRVRSGEEILFLISTAPVRDEGGKIIYLVKSFRDISRIKQMEEAAAQTQLKYMNLFENLMDGFAYHKVVTDKNCEPVDYIFLEVNSAYERLTGLRRNDLIGKRVTEVLPSIVDSEFDWIGTFGRVGLTGESIRVEQYSEPLGRWYAVNGFCPEPGTFAVLFEEITERKAKEQTVRAELEEKEILMREFHQRVKRNLLSVSHILNIQASYIPEEWDWTSKVLKDTQIRIMSMGLIQEALYGLGNLDRIPISAYTKELVKRLKENLGKVNGSIEINTDIPDDLTMNVETATMVGLIVTELVSNSIRHAFAPGEEGEITVICREGEEGQYVLEGKDNGLGIPEHISFTRPETLGLKLLNSYIEIIDGQLDVSRDGGTVVTVSFRDNAESGAVLY